MDHAIYHPVFMEVCIKVGTKVTYFYAIQDEDDGTSADFAKELQRVLGPKATVTTKKTKMPFDPNRERDFE